MFVREGVSFGGKELTIETGRMAKQADGSVVIRYGDTMVLVTAVASNSVRPGIDFMPLTVDYLEKTSAAGKIPGGYFKREGRMTEVEMLTSRLIDRPSRPLFPKGWRFDTQVIAMVVSTDSENPLRRAGDDRRVVRAAHSATSRGRARSPACASAASTASSSSTRRSRSATKSDLDLVVAASRDAIVMVEGGAAEVSEDAIIDALMFAHKAAQPLLDLQEKLRAAVGKPKREFIAAGEGSGDRRARRRHRRREDPGRDGDPREARALRRARRRRQRDRRGADRRATPSGCPRSRRRSSRRRRSTCASWCCRPASASTAATPADDPRHHLRGRPPAAHARLGAVHARRDPGAGHDHARHEPGRAAHRRAHRRRREALPAALQLPALLDGRGEAAARRGRREIGHGHLAERALSRVLPGAKDFPYTIRIVSEILESNG